MSHSGMTDEPLAASTLLDLGLQRFGTVLADPPWRFQNRTGKVAPEHQRLKRYRTMSLDEIAELPIAQVAAPQSHLYLWVPNALIMEGLEVMHRWGFTYKTNLIWYKIRKDGGPDGRGVGFYFRNVTEMVLFGVRGHLRTYPPGRRQTNIISTRKREHSRKPDELYDIIEACSPGPYLEMFARHDRPNWSQWGDEAPDDGLLPFHSPHQPASETQCLWPQFEDSDFTEFPGNPSRHGERLRRAAGQFTHDFGADSEDL